MNVYSSVHDRCYSLVYGTFCFSEHITDGGAEMLGNLPALSSLDISGCSITDTVSLNRK